MENGQNLQGIADSKSQEAPEVVQQSAELKQNEETKEQTEEVVPEVDEVVNASAEEITAEESQSAISKTKTEVVEQPVATTSEIISEEASTEEVEAGRSDEPIEDHLHEHEDHEDEHEDHEDEHEEFDFHEASKEELLVKIREVSKEDRIRRVDRVIKALKPRFDELYDEERSVAFKKFESEGNDPEAFEYHGDEADKEFLTIYGDLRSKRNKYFKELEHQKEDNLKKKETLLEKLRELVDGDESSASFNAVKDIQVEWKKIGPVPGAHNKTLWANYNALLDRFYDQRSIYFELKDLDRKKNLKIKAELCEKAEALAKEEDLKVAIVQLNELHEEYKHAGSVPKEDQEVLWQRFKSASDAVYSRRKAYFDQLKVELEDNYLKKVELAKEAEVYTSFNSDKITDWNDKTKEIQSLQKKWEAIGGLPRDKAKATNKQFWGAFKTFFNHKNQFFKQLESQRDDNLKKKEELVTLAEELKENSDWNATTQKFKDLQMQWKEIGPVPEKVRNEVYRRFKTACDHFFDRRRAQNSEQEREYQENLNLKLQICDQIENIADQDEINLDDVYDLIDNHAQIGFVPRNAIKKAQSRFEEATGKILSLEELEHGDKMDLKNHIQMSRMRNTRGGDRKFHRMEHSIKRKISELENNIATWNTNMEFFASSATADKLKADLQKQINEAKGELEDLKSQLSSLSS